VGDLNKQPYVNALKFTSTFTHTHRNLRTHFHIHTRTHLLPSPAAKGYDWVFVLSCAPSLSHTRHTALIEELSGNLSTWQHLCCPKKKLLRAMRGLFPSRCLAGGCLRVLGSVLPRAMTQIGATKRSELSHCLFLKATHQSRDTSAT